MNITQNTEMIGSLQQEKSRCLMIIEAIDHWGKEITALDNKMIKLLERSRVEEKSVDCSGFRGSDFYWDHLHGHDYENSDTLTIYMGGRGKQSKAIRNDAYMNQVYALNKKLLDERNNILELKDRLEKRSRRGFELLEENKELKERIEVATNKLEAKNEWLKESGSTIEKLLESNKSLKGYVDILENRIKEQNKKNGDLVKENKELKEDITNYKYELTAEHRKYVQNELRKRLLEENEKMNTALKDKEETIKMLKTEIDSGDINTEIARVQITNILDTYLNGGTKNENPGR